jgi:hypothetical protein
MSELKVFVCHTFFGMVPYTLRARKIGTNKEK